MNANFNVTGTERKKLVTAVSEVVGTAAVYNGAPTFSYTVGNFTIDKNGTITAKASTTDEYEGLILQRLSEQGFTFEQPTDETEKPTQSDRLIIEMSLDGFTDETITNLQKLVESKASLIKKALGIDSLLIEISDDKVSFPWFTPQDDGLAVRAYTRFISALCKMAKTQKRVSATEKPIENEKYAFRCFLLRLGFIGVEYKTERKILLQNLSGSSAFKEGSTKQQNISEAQRASLAVSDDE